MKHSVFNAKRIYIWGTGRNGKAFMQKYGLYILSDVNAFKEDWENNFLGFIDNAADKAGTVFFDKDVVDSHTAFLKMDFCIITVADNEMIIKQLEECGFGNDQWILWSDYLKECRQRFCEAKDEEKLLGNNALTEKLKVIRKVSDSGIVRPLDVIDAMEWYFGDNIDAAQKFFDTYLHMECRRTSKIQRIGIVIDRLYGGGIEKVVSLLKNSFEKKGYEITLLTDKEEAKGKDTNCVYFREKGGLFSESRLEDLEEAIKKQNLDVLCFHSGYARVDSFYEILLAKMLGAYVTMEIHSAFIALLKDQIDISKSFFTMYRAVDRLITISETDDFFWSCAGCRSDVIDNPIETFGVKEKTERSIDKDYCEIVWVGRIVQTPKRVLDAIRIFELVCQKMDNVRLRIVGMKDNIKVYEKLTMMAKSLQGKVEICEFTPNVADMYASADVVLLTSSSESFSNVLAESKVFARPVVMYELPWLRLAGENTGVWSVKQRDMAAASEAIVRLLNDKALWQQYSDDAWNSIQQDMKRDVTDDWEKLFRQLEQNKYDAKHVDDGECKAISLFIDQLFGAGYPYSIDGD